MRWHLKTIGTKPPSLLILNGDRIAGSLVLHEDGWHVEIPWADHDITFTSQDYLAAATFIRSIEARIAEADLFAVAKQITLEFGYDWTDPRTGETHKAAAR